MAIFNRFPFSNSHELNLDWILRQLKDLLRRVKHLEESESGGGGDPGTTNYNDLSNKPKINNVTLQGNKSSTDLNIPTTTTIRAEISHAFQLYDPAEEDYDPPYAAGTLGYAIENAAVDPEDIQTAVDSYLDDHPTVTGTFTNAAKNALLDLLEKVTYIDGNGQTYLENLRNELFASTVISITAVFTQGAAIIYDSDSLEALEPYLTVTANYSDGTSEVITTYILSGDLAIGVSTITATYQGETSTFTVTVTDSALKPVPIGYTRYDYILNNNIGTSGSGGNGICMNTGLIGSEYAKITYEHDLLFDANGVTSEATSPVYGMRAGTGNANIPTSRVLFIAKRTEGFTGPGYSYQYNSVSGAWNQLVENANFHFVSRNKQIYVNDVLVADNVEGSDPYSPANITIALWGEHRDNYYAVKAYIKMRHFIVRDASGKAVAAMYPAQNSNNVNGMYDVVRNQFFTANTASALTCGND